jgi:hypothetical protein
MDVIEIDRATRQQYERDGYVAFPRLLEPAEVERLRVALRDVMARLLADARDGKARYRPPKPGGTSNYDGALVSRDGSRVELLTEPGFDPLANGGDQRLTIQARAPGNSAAPAVIAALDCGDPSYPRIRRTAVIVMTDS